MSGDYTAADVENACLLVYKSSESQQRKSEANEWLLRFQFVAGAWEISKALLQSQHAEVQFFGAITIQVKIKKEWHLIPPQQQDELQKWLLGVLREQNSLSPLASSRLALALAIVAVRLQTKNRWPNMIPDVMATCQQNPQLITLVLEFAQYLPDEIEGHIMTHSERSRLVECVTQNMAALAAAASQALRMPAGDPTSRALAFLTKWISSDTNKAVIAMLFEPTYGLFDLVCSFLNHPTYHQAVVELLCELFSQRMDQERNLWLLSRVLALKAFYDQAIAANHSLTLARGASRIVGSYLKGQSAFVSRSAHVAEVQQLLMNALDYTASADKEVSRSCIPFWQQLVADVRDETRPVFLPVYSRLLQVLLQSACFPADFTSWATSSLDQDEFNDYRIEVGNSLRAVLHVLEGSYLEMISQSLRASISQQWQPLEALLYATASVAENVSGRARADEFLPQIFQLAVSIPPNDQITRTVVSMFASYAGWLSESKAAEAPTRFVLHALQQKATCKAAALAFRDLARNCAAQMLTLIREITAAFQKAASIMKGESREAMIEGIMRVIERHPDDAEVGAAMAELTAPLLDSLKVISETSVKLLHGNQQKDADAAISLLAHYLRLLSVCFKSETMRLEPVWPLFERLFVAFQAHSRVENALCDIFANAVAAQKGACAPVLGVLLNVTLQYYSTTLQAAPLNVFAAVVKTFGNAAPEPISNLLMVVTQATGSLLQRNDPLSEHHDVIAAYFHFLASAQETCAHLLYTPALLPLVLQITAASVMLPERTAVKAVCTVLARMMAGTDPRFHAVIGEALVPRLELLIGCLVRAMLLPRQKQAGVMQALADALFNIKSRVPAEQAAILFANSIRGLDFQGVPLETVLRPLVQLSDKRLFQSYLAELSKVHNLEATADFITSFQH